MGGGAVVADPAGRQKAFLADRAVFTSVRSPLGEGYRLVVCTAGITSAERREITQRSPSHGSLCDASKDGRALASYWLESGRNCVACSRSAGLEHTARGGQRIHTDIVVLDRAAYENCGCDPLVVLAAVESQVEQNDNFKPPAHIEPLSIHPTRPTDADAPVATDGLGGAEFDRLTQTLALLLCRSPVIGVGVQNPQAILGILLTGLPQSYRRTLSTSCGLRLSPLRRFQLALVQTAPNEARRFVHDGGVSLCDWTSFKSHEPSPFDAWLSFVRRRWEKGRLAELDQLSRRAGGDSSPQQLGRVAELCDAISRVELADLAELDAMFAHAGRLAPGSPLQAELNAELQTRIRERRCNLVDGRLERLTQSGVTRSPT